MKHCINWKMKEHIKNYNDGCELGLRCRMSHGWKEQQYHPSSYKTHKCEVQGCKKGSCPNYHSDKEKRHSDQTVVSQAFKYVAKNRLVEGTYKSPKIQDEQAKLLDKTTVKPQTHAY